MRCGKYKTSISIALAISLLSLTIGYARGQQSTDASAAGLLTGQQSGPQPEDGTGFPLQYQAGGTRRLPDGQYQADGLNLQNSQESSRPTSSERDNAASSLRDLDRLPPDTLTEFQRLVQSSTGSLLPIYGAQLFRNAPTTFAPLDRVPVPIDYVIGPGDELLIQIWGQVSLNSRFTVDRAGNIYIPQVGTLRVAGQPFAELQGYLKQQMSRVFHNFDLNVNMGQLRSIQIFVLGQVRRPGSYTISSLSSLVDALFVTGGPAPQGSLRHIQLKRAGQVVADFDLYDLLEHGDKSKDKPLLPGDVVYVPPVGPQVAIAGSVNAPAIYELKSKHDSTVAEALAMAAGTTNVASQTRVRLEHVDAHSMRSVTDLSLDQAGLSTVLQDGDILELNAIVDRFRNGITLRGNVANPGHYAWKPGMRVGDLFPDKDALITRDYWLRRGQLGEPTLTYAPYCPPEVAGGQNSRNCLALSSSPSLNNEQAQGNIGLQNTATAESQQKSSNLGPGSIATASLDHMPTEFPARNDVTLNAPEIDWSYAVIERQDINNLTTTLLPFNLGKLVLDGDVSQNLELKPNDVITIFSKADIRVPQTQQTRFVRLEGEFVSSGVYSVLPGETLERLVARAGGVTSDAYLFGAAFTRESTQRVQQQRLNSYIDQLSLQAGVTAANTASRNVSTTDTAAAAALQTQNQNIINNLRNTRASGRILLGLTPETKSATELPQLSLENGDIFMVPHRPSTVSVAGAVYEPNTFIFENGRKVGYYLGLAGGPNHDADRKRAYVVRADGSVISKQQMSSLRGNNFDKLPIYPGDTVIIPMNLNKGATLRNIVDLSQIFGQFGIALAAANVLF